MAVAHSVVSELWSRFTWPPQEATIQIVVLAGILTAVWYCCVWATRNENEP